MWRFIPVILSFILISAHFLRTWNFGIVALFIGAPLLLISKRHWTVHILRFLLLIAAVEWVATTEVLVSIRIEAGEAWLRLALILGLVIVLTVWATVLLGGKYFRDRCIITGNQTSALSAFILTGVLLSIVHLVVDPPVILAERFLLSGGWLEIFWLSIYAAWLADMASDVGAMRKLRPIIWGIFSILFFMQFILGISGIEKFLMSGELHLPVPAMIVAGPLFRGGGLFMPILFGATILLTGPAWCSWLCYMGSWDHYAASSMAERKRLPMWREKLRAGILLLTVILAYVLGRIGGLETAALYLAGGFGIVGVIVMILWSGKTGQMAHCTSYCPIGFLAVILGKINPFRLRIRDDCIGCDLCARACRYDALNPEDIEKRVPALSCTLCGDCVSACDGGSLEYRFPGLKADSARIVFIIMVISLHAVFLGVAKL